MKYIALVFTFFFICFNSYSQQKIDNKTIVKEIKPKITVYYFHGTRRCASCMGAEKSTVSALNELYKDKLDKGIIKYTALNLEETQNKALVEKYQIGWSTLLFIKDNNGKEEKVDLTQDAFSYGRSNPEKLKQIIKTTIDKMLK